MTIKQLQQVGSILLLPLTWARRTSLVRPRQHDWNPSLALREVNVRGHTLAYAVKGEGGALVMIHGYGAGSWVWERQVDVLSRFYRVHVLDLIGHGFSDRPRIAYTPETYVRCVRDFMDAAGLPQATLIGNSMGGGVAWAMAIAFPERVKALVLIDAVPPDVLGQVKNDSFRTLVATRPLPFLAYLLLASRTRGSIRRLLHECVADGTRVTPNVVDRQYQLSRITGTTWVLYSTFKHAEEAMVLKEHLCRISHPTLILWGERDLIFPVSVGETLSHLIPGSTLRVIPESGHIPMWETSEEVNEALLSFLRKV